MKIFVDTNIVIDLLARREPFYNEAATLFSLANKNKIELAVSSLTIANTNYVLLRQLESSKAKAILRKLSLLVKILPLNDRIIGLALNDEYFTNFDDGLQYYSAIENEQEIIITRNIKDFKSSKIPSMTAKQFLQTFIK